MDLEEMKNLPPREFAEKLFASFKAGKISPAKLKKLSEVYCEANNIKIGGK